jgi:DNA-binding NarL/FixJ family response regulator
MNLDYKILWFEDQKTYFDSITSFVQEVVENLGFNFIQPTNEINGNNIDTIKFEDYDLIIMDLKLANNQKGSELLNRIRGNEIYTEVVFYSSDGESAVREALREYEIDGVYCSSRQREDFIYKIEKVIHTTVKKVQDVNNMRGLIMAGTSDLDGIMKDIIEVILKSDKTDTKKALVENIFKDVESSITEKSGKFEKWKSSTNIDKLMSDTMMFDASKKINAIQLLLDLVESEISKEYKDSKFKEDYSKEINYYRNIFAHVKVETDANGKKKLMSKNNEVEFTHDFCLDIRKNLIKYNSLLNGFHGHLLN